MTTATMLNPAVVDVVSIAPDGCVNLYIVREDDWTGSTRELQLLRDKVHNYVAYATDGQLQRDHPATAGLAWRIVVQSYGAAPTTDVMQSLGRLALTVRHFGGDVFTAA